MNNKEPVSLLEPELSYEVQGCIYNTANKYGKGLKESIYQKALAEEFQKAGLNFEQQKRINIHSVETGKVLGTYIPDFIVSDKIIVEIKANNFTGQNDINQQRSYLRASVYEVAYLVNFNSQKLKIKRSIYTNDRKPFITQLKNIRD